MSEKPTWQADNSEMDDAIAAAVAPSDNAPAAPGKQLVVAWSSRSDWVSAVTAEAGEAEAEPIAADPALLAAVADSLLREDDELAAPDAETDAEIVAPEADPALDAAAAEAFAHDELEHGIAHVLASLRAEADEQEETAEEAEAASAPEDGAEQADAQDDPEDAEADDLLAVAGDDEDTHSGADDAEEVSATHAAASDSLADESHEDESDREESEDASDEEFDDAVTYRLLGELDRLWHHRAA